nr:hypothetical protein [Pyrinomonadaceae bacterium]
AAIEYKGAIIDRHCSLPSWRELLDHWRRAAGGQEEVMREVLAQWQRAAEGGLDSVTQTEVATLATFALSGPGVVLGARFTASTQTASPTNVTASY